MDNLLKIEEVAVLVGSSVNTINFWYRFKRMEPDNEYAKQLPDFIQSHPRQTRYWKREDVWKLIEFKQNLPHGRGGVMGNATWVNNKWKSKEKKNGTKKD